MGARTLLHVDLDAFYASVEQRDEPRLRGRPVVVGGNARRGVVCAASYEARRFGVRSAMPMAQALKLCPQATVIRPRIGHYADVSEQFFAILGRFTPLVEGLSLDEAYLDVTGTERLHGDGRAVAEAVKRGVRDELALVASVGVAPVKLAAKIASDLGKPDGLVVVAPGEVAAFLAPLPVWRLWGVGEVLERQLRGLGLATIGDVAAAGSALAARVGADAAERLRELARGRDDRAVEASRAAVSVGSEDTFDDDVRDRGELAIHLLAQADRCCARVRALEKRARVVTIKIKYANHDLVTRRRTLPRPTADGRVVGDVARDLLAEVPAIERRGVRLTGVSLSGLGDAAAPRQLDLGEADAERGEALGAVQDRIAARFGPGALKRAVHLKE
ncbi:MAG TPA: DNA polymerase IV [Haliangiales bacterium]|nr:DNA polymerase IV [Haliangiales bacterium]